MTEKGKKSAWHFENVCFVLVSGLRVGVEPSEEEGSVRQQQIPLKLHSLVLYSSILFKNNFNRHSEQGHLDE